MLSVPLPRTFNVRIAERYLSGGEPEGDRVKNQRQFSQHDRSADMGPTWVEFTTSLTEGLDLFFCEKIVHLIPITDISFL